MTTLCLDQREGEPTDTVEEGPKVQPGSNMNSQTERVEITIDAV